jgi:hypothetical protein
MEVRPDNLECFDGSQGTTKGIEGSVASGNISLGVARIAGAWAGKDLSSEEMAATLASLFTTFS